LDERQRPNVQRIAPGFYEYREPRRAGEERADTFCIFTREAGERQGFVHQIEELEEAGWSEIDAESRGGETRK
jgi:hypothetical protein